jgi:hypothetical protein
VRSIAPPTPAEAEATAVAVTSIRLGIFAAASRPHVPPIIEWEVCERPVLRAGYPTTCGCLCVATERCPACRARSQR